jgi:type I restriction enzyme R subunit
MNKKELTETEIRSKFITAALTKLGGKNWVLMTKIREKVHLTKVRVIVPGESARRGEAKKADFVISYMASILSALEVELTTT